MASHSRISLTTLTASAAGPWCVYGRTLRAAMDTLVDTLVIGRTQEPHQPSFGTNVNKPEEGM